jgi:quinol monooxygenase YgiN
MIRLNAFIQVKEGKKAELLAVTKELVEKSLQDAGCVAYDVFDSTTRSDVMMICETWRDAESLAAHSASAHFTTLVPKIEALGSLKLEQFEF